MGHRRLYPKHLYENLDHMGILMPFQLEMTQLQQKHTKNMDEYITKMVNSIIICEKI
jgi:hypothetical protein